MELGGWDEVRFGADNEFYRRLLLLEKKSRNIVCHTVPLAFYSAREDSLSAERDTGLSTLILGARREYQDSYRHWHLAEIAKQEPNLAIAKDRRPFPVPNICRSRRPNALAYDILFVSDYTFPGGTTSSNINMMSAASRLGLRCGAFHWPRMLYAGSAMNLKMRQALHEGIVEAVVAPEAVNATLVIVYQPMLLNDLPEKLPAVQADYCVLGINQTPMSRSSGGRDLYDLDHAIENLHRAFGLEPFIAPVSPVVRKVLQANSAYPHYTQEDWPGLIDSAAWRRSRFSWDGSRAPIIGRHSRDSTDKWPSDPVALRQAYCADTRFDIRILGGAEKARAVLGRIPRNWTVQPFDSLGIKSFLSGLDFFIHYPHESWIEAFARAPIEAMATGVPVIVPSHLRELYGEGALYAEPGDVQALVQSLWNDKTAYEAQVTRGFEFVDRTCDLARFADRVAPYLGTSKVAPPASANFNRFESAVAGAMPQHATQGRAEA